MNYLASICLLLCATTIYAIDFTKFVEKCCVPLVDQFMQNEGCTDYQVPAYLEKLKEKLAQNKHAKLMMNYFDKGCCAMEKSGVVSEEIPLNIERLKEHASTLITDDNVRDKMFTCIDEKTDGISADKMNIADFFPDLSKCIFCNCMNSKAKKSIGSMMGC